MITIFLYCLSELKLNCLLLSDPTDKGRLHDATGLFPLEADSEMGFTSRRFHKQCFMEGSEKKHNWADKVKL